MQRVADQPPLVAHHQQQEHAEGEQADPGRGQAGQAELLLALAQLGQLLGHPLLLAVDERPEPTLQAVVGGVLVRLRLGRDVEGRVDEVVDGGAEVERRLAEVDQLGGHVAEHVDAEQPPVGAREQAGYLRDALLLRALSIVVCSVVNIFANSPIGYDARALQLGKMTRDAGLAHAQNLLQLRNRKLFLLEEQQQANRSYLDEGVRLLELARRAHWLFQQVHAQLCQCGREFLQRLDAPSLICVDDQVRRRRAATDCWRWPVRAQTYSSRRAAR